MNRKDSIAKLNKVNQWDIVIIGGGASGLGIAVDASCLLYTSPSPRD